MNNKSLKLSIFSITLTILLTGCTDITPLWWESSPIGYFGFPEFLWRALALMLPVAFVTAISGDSDSPGFIPSFFFVYIAVFIFAGIGTVLLWIITYGVFGETMTVEYLFACFCICAFGIGLFGLGIVTRLLGGHSSPFRFLGIIGLIIEIFGTYFTIRDILNWLNP